MSIYVTATTSKRELPVVGKHQAVCSHVEDIGSQTSKYGTKHELAIIWELAEKRSDGAPHTYGQTFAATMSSDSNLRKVVEAWHAKKYEDKEQVDLETRVGKNCLITLAPKTKQDGSAGVKIGAIEPLPAGMAPIKATIIDPPKWVIEARAKSPEFGGNYHGSADDCEPDGVI